MRVNLRRAAHVRSGDKGNTATIGVIAYSEALYAHIKSQVTAEAVKALYGEAITGMVRRYEVDAIGALNFTVEGALGGGVSRSLAMDNYGKALCAALLSLELDIPEGVANELRGA